MWLTQVTIKMEKETENCIYSVCTVCAYALVCVCACDQPHHNEQGIVLWIVKHHEPWIWALCNCDMTLHYIMCADGSGLSGYVRSLTELRPCENSLHTFLILAHADCMICTQSVVQDICIQATKQGGQQYVHTSDCWYWHNSYSRTNGIAGHSGQCYFSFRSQLLSLSTSHFAKMLQFTFMIIITFYYVLSLVIRWCGFSWITC